MRALYSYFIVIAALVSNSVFANSSAEIPVGTRIVPIDLSQNEFYILSANEQMPKNDRVKSKALRKIVAQVDNTLQHAIITNKHETATVKVALQKHHTYSKLAVVFKTKTLNEKKLIHSKSKLALKQHPSFKRFALAKQS